MVTQMFKDQIGKTIKVYIEDIVVKTKESGGHTGDLVEVFGIIKATQAMPQH